MTEPFVELPDPTPPMTARQKAQALMWFVGIVVIAGAIYFVWPALFYNCGLLSVTGCN